MDDATTIIMKVEGMSCAHCVKAVTAAIRAEDANARVEVDLAQHTVTTRTTLPRDRVGAAVEREGYKVVG